MVQFLIFVHLRGGFEGVMAKLQEILLDFLEVDFFAHVTDSVTGLPVFLKDIPDRRKMEVNAPRDLAHRPLVLTTEVDNINSFLGLYLSFTLDVETLELLLMWPAAGHPVEQLLVFHCSLFSLVLFSFLMEVRFFEVDIYPLEISA